MALHMLAGWTLAISSQHAVEKIFPTQAQASIHGNWTAASSAVGIFLSSCETRVDKLPMSPRRFLLVANLTVSCSSLAASMFESTQRPCSQCKRRSRPSLLRATDLLLAFLGVCGAIEASAIRTGVLGKRIWPSPCIDERMPPP